MVMKYALLLLGLVFSLSACSQKTSNSSQELYKVENFTVSGNCGMCKKTIETAALSVKGVSKASWDVDTHIMTVFYNTDKVTLAQIQQKIAAAGYDNDGQRGNDTAYAKLPACCHYERRQ